MKAVFRVGFTPLFILLCLFVSCSPKKTASYFLDGKTIIREETKSLSVFSIFENGEKLDEVTWKHEKPPYEDSGTLFSLYWDKDTVFIIGNDQWYKHNTSQHNVFKIVLDDELDPFFNGGDFGLISKCDSLQTEGRHYLLLNAFETECRFNHFDDLNPILIRATYKKGKQSFSNY